MKLTICFHKLNSIIPTVGMDEKHIKMKNMKVCLRDVSGHWRSRQLWHSFFAETNVLVRIFKKKKNPNHLVLWLTK